MLTAQRFRRFFYVILTLIGLLGVRWLFEDIKPVAIDDLSYQQLRAKDDFLIAKAWQSGAPANRATSGNAEVLPSPLGAKTLGEVVGHGKAEAFLADFAQRQHKNSSGQEDIYAEVSNYLRTDENARQYLLARLSSEADEEVRSAISFVLGSSGQLDVVDAAAKSMESGNDRDALVSLKILEQAQRSAPQARQHLIQLATDPSKTGEDLAKIVNALAQYIPTDETELANTRVVLQSLLHDQQDAQVRAAAWRAMNQITANFADESLGLLVERRESPEVLRAALSSLEESGTQRTQVKEAIFLLMERNETDLSVRQAAAVALNASVLSKDERARLQRLMPYVQ